jgi:hypothetical protein
MPFWLMEEVYHTHSHGEPGAAPRILARLFSETKKYGELLFELVSSDRPVTLQLASEMKIEWIGLRNTD